jgi:tetratricopeptide (TPR) repeat protein
MMLGNVLNETGRFEEAIACFERAIELAPGEAIAYHRLLSSRKVGEAERPWIARIESRLQAADVPGEQGMLFHFAAGKAQDDLGEYEAAMRHFDAGNQLRRKMHAPLDRARVEEQMDRLIARFTRDFFASHAPLGSRDETPVLVLGLPRSGTTLIERIISSHPEVAGGGELDYWEEHGPAWVDAPDERLAEGVEKLRAGYLEVLRGIGPDAARVTDKMPFNFVWLGLVHRVLPGARVVHCRRNPVDTCLSLYTTYLNRVLDYATDRADLVWYFRQYLRLMEHWRTVLPADRFLDVDYEDPIAKPEDTARRLVAFCGLEWDPACLQPERNPDAVKTASSWQVRQPVYRGSVERWRHYEPWLGELRELLPGG